MSSEREKAIQALAASTIAAMDRQKTNYTDRVASKKVKGVPGKCPNCNCDDLDYTDKFVYSDTFEMSYICPECDLVGKEIFKFKFHVHA